MQSVRPFPCCRQDVSIFLLLPGALLVVLMCLAAAPMVRAVDGVSDVYLWYYGVDPTDIDQSLDGSGVTVRLKARAGLDPRDPNDDEHVQIEHIKDDDPTCPQKFVLSWQARKGIFYQVFSSTDLLGPAASWLPQYEDWVMAEQTGFMTFEHCADPDEKARFYRLGASNGDYADLNGLTPYDHALIAAAPANLDRDNNGLPDQWEWLHFGMLGVDPNADADGDGLSNKAEYLAGTNPNAASETVEPAGLSLIVYSP